MATTEQISDADREWLRNARPGSVIVRHETTGMLGHVYGTQEIPDGFTVALTQDDVR